MENLGNTTADGRNEYNQAASTCDKVTLSASAGNLSLIMGAPQTVVVNPLSFEIGWTGDMTQSETKSNVYTLTRNITVNGITKPLVQTLTHGVTYNQDSLIVNAGAPVEFGNILVTPLGWTTGFFSDSAGLFTQTSPLSHTISPVSAEFSLAPVPEPAFFQMGALLGMSGMGVFKLRRKA